MIGCTGAGLDFIVYAALSALAGLHYQLANFLGVSCGIVNNFFLNYFFNFRSQNRLLPRLGMFYLVGMCGWALSALCLYLSIETLGLQPLLAKLGTIALVTAVQFALNKTITFRKARRHA